MWITFIGTAALFFLGMISFLWHLRWMRRLPALSRIGWFIARAGYGKPSDDSSRQKVADRWRQKTQQPLLHFYCTTSQVLDYQWSG
jgi:hypothetical protein